MTTANVSAILIHPRRLDLKVGAAVIFGLMAHSSFAATVALEPVDPGTEQLQLRLSTAAPARKKVLSGNASTPPLKISTSLAEAATPQQTQPEKQPLVLNASSDLTLSPDSRVAALEPLEDDMSPLKLVAADRLAPEAAKAGGQNLTNTIRPLRLSLTGILAKFTSGAGLKLSVSQSLTVASVSPSSPAPKPGAPGERGKQPALPSQERGRNGRTATAAVKPEENSPSGSSQQGLFTAFVWAVPPIAWGGSVSMGIGYGGSNSGDRSTSISESISIGGNSYIYAPWFARVNGSVALATAHSKSTPAPINETPTRAWEEVVTGASSAITGSSGNTNSITGGGTLALFPVSRFPTTVSLDVSNNNNISSLNNIGNTRDKSTTTRFGVVNFYRPESSEYNLNSSLYATRTQSLIGGSDNVINLNSDYRTLVDEHQITANAGLSDARGSSSGQGSTSISLSATHSYPVLENMTVSSGASFTSSTQKYLAGTELKSATGMFTSLNTSASWHPEEDDDGYVMPLTVSGGANASFQNSETPGGISKYQNIGANVGANYNYSRNLYLSANALATQVSSGSSSQIFSMLSANASYNADPRKIFGFDHGWSASAAANMVGSDISESSQTLSESLRQTLSRSFVIGEHSNLGIGLQQSISHSTGGADGSVAGYSGEDTAGNIFLSHGASTSFSTGGISLSAGHSVNHAIDDGKARISSVSSSAGAGYSINIAGVNSNFTANVNDSRSENGSRLSSADINARGQISINRYSAASISMSGQRYHSTEQTPEGIVRTRSGYVIGTASYDHVRAFGVPGLRYNASATANASASLLEAERLSGRSDSVRKPTIALEHRLDYRIGLLDFRASGALNKTEGTRSGSVSFTVSRSF